MLDAPEVRAVRLPACAPPRPCPCAPFPPQVKCIPVGAVTVMVAGETPNNLNSDKLGEFIRLTGRQMNGRPVYAQLGNDNRMLW